MNYSSINVENCPSSSVQIAFIFEGMPNCKRENEGKCSKWHIAKTSTLITEIYIIIVHYYKDYIL